MPYRETVEDRQWDSFTECPTGETARRVKVCNNIATTPSGLSIAGKITVVTLNSSTWTALPATALTDRNAMGIQNQSAIEIKLNYDNGVSGYVGVKLAADSERYYDITDDIIIYAKSQSGTPTVIVEEIS